MPLKNTHYRWGALSQLLHWTIVALIIVQYVLAQTIDGLPRGLEKLKLLTYHKSIGVTVLALAVLRLLWRWVNPTPLLPGTLKPYERVLAKITHLALYLLIFAIPLSGWIMSNAENSPVSYFGKFALPRLVTPNKPLGELMGDAHEVLFYTLVAVAVLHILAALKHHFLLKDNVLKRMLPFTSTPPGGSAP